VFIFFLCEPPLSQLSECRVCIFLNKTFLDLLLQKGAARKIYSSPELAGGCAGGWLAAPASLSLIAALQT
jgi:hypothetical protein